eukprot:scaffold26111_cov34-Phaeocystis_antarctica.AAC.1
MFTWSTHNLHRLHLGRILTTADLVDVPCGHEADGGNVLLHVPEWPVGLQAGGAPAAPLQLA